MSYLNKLTEKIVPCPFDPLHLIREGGLQYHIVRCMKNHPGYMTCPYNACHRLKDRAAFERHLKVCENKDMMLRDAIRDKCITKHGDVSETPIDVGNSSWNTEEEDWSRG